MSLQWSLLSQSELSYPSPLLVKHEISSSAYTIHVTDLTHIWTESLDRKQIIRRAFDENVSIDPSEGPDQFRLLLQIIEKSLTGGPDTNLDARLVGEDSSLMLEITASLPPPLNPLVWHIHLTRAPQKLLSTELVLPCLRELSHGRTEVASLLVNIKEKDHVIGRLSDKLEAAGIELNTVFPSAAPGRRSKASLRESVPKSVKGLSVFDPEKLRRSIASAGHSDDGVITLLDEVFSRRESDNPRPHEKPDEYQRMENNFSMFITDGGNAATQSQESSQTRKADDEDFQRYPLSIVETHRTHNQVLTTTDGRMNTPIMSNARSSTSGTSDDDLDAPILRTPEKAALPSSATVNGSRESGVLKDSKTSPLPSKPSDSEHTFMNDTQEEESGSAGLPADTSIPIPKMDRSRRKIGMIGGHHKGAKLQELASEVTTSTPLLAANIPQINRLNDNDSERCGRGSSKLSESSAPVRETSQERADRNRARLKRELEQKNKLPVKKKRKF
ncbi:hypothetical protein MMC13_004987 [Lambiella insularis]|nr:hypothetical protein [Lambiella insularis]